MRDRNPFFDPQKHASGMRKWVTVSNDLITARLDWSLMMHRILIILVSQIDSKNDKTFKPQLIKVKDIRDWARLSHNSLHQEVIAATRELVRQPIETWSEEKQRYVGYPIFSKCEYRWGEGILEAQFNEHARPFLLQLSERFTKYRAQQALSLSTPYAIRAYEIAKMVERPRKTSSHVVSIEAFRRAFALEKKYARHRDMRRRVLNPAIEEVNATCDVKVVCDDVREGRTPVALRWTVTPKPTSVSKRSRKKLEPASRKTAPVSKEHRSAPARYERWLEHLTPEKRARVEEDARKRAEAQGYDPQKPAFEAIVQMELASACKEEIGQ